MVLNSKEKVKPGFLLSLMCMFTKSKTKKNLISQLTPPIFRYFGDQNGRKKDPMKIIFGNFQKVDEKMGPFV